MAAKSKGRRGKPAKDKTVAPKEKKYISVTPNNKINKKIEVFKIKRKPKESKKIRKRDQKFKDKSKQKSEQKKKSKTEIHEKKVDVKMRTRLSNPKVDIPKVDYPPIESKRHKSNSTCNTRKTTNKQQIKRENNKRKRLINTKKINCKRIKNNSDDDFEDEIRLNVKKTPDQKLVKEIPLANDANLMIESKHAKEKDIKSNVKKQKTIKEMLSLKKTKINKSPCEEEKIEKTMRNNITENESKHAKRKFLNERLVEQTVEKIGEVCNSDSASVMELNKIYKEQKSNKGRKKSKQHKLNNKKVNKKVDTNTKVKELCEEIQSCIKKLSPNTRDKIEMINKKKEEIQDFSMTSSPIFKQSKSLLKEKNKQADDKHVRMKPNYVRNLINEFNRQYIDEFESQHNIDDDSVDLSHEGMDKFEKQTQQKINKLKSSRTKKKNLNKEKVVLLQDSNDSNQEENYLLPEDNSLNHSSKPAS